MHTQSDRQADRTFYFYYNSASVKMQFLQFLQTGKI